MLDQIIASLDPSTVNGAFIISLISGLLVSFITGFFVGKKVERNNTIKMRDNDGVIIQGSSVRGGVNGK